MRSSGPLYLYVPPPICSCPRVCFSANGTTLHSGIWDSSLFLPSPLFPTSNITSLSFSSPFSWPLPLTRPPESRLDFRDHRDPAGLPLQPDLHTASTVKSSQIPNLAIPFPCPKPEVPPPSSRNPRHFSMTYKSPQNPSSLNCLSSGSSTRVPRSALFAVSPEGAFQKYRFPGPRPEILIHMRGDWAQEICIFIKFPRNF